MPAPQNYKPDNWFSRLLERKGEDYITSGKLTIDEVNKNAERIIDDIIKGKIDYNKYGNCMITPVVLDTLINYCTNQLAIKSAIQFALGYTHNDYVNNTIMHSVSPIPQYQFYSTDDRRIPAAIDDNLASNIAEAMNIINQDIIIYSMLLQTLKSVDVTKNPYELFSLTNRLNPYTKIINKRY